MVITTFYANNLNSCMPKCWYRSLCFEHDNVQSHPSPVVVLCLLPWHRHLVEPTAFRVSSERHGQCGGTNLPKLEAAAGVLAHPSSLLTPGYPYTGLPLHPAVLLTLPTIDVDNAHAHGDNGSDRRSIRAILNIVR